MHFHQRRHAPAEVTSCCCHHSWNTSLSTSLYSHPLSGLQKLSASTDECQWMPFFPRGGIQWHTFPSYTLPCQTPLCQTAPLLPSVTQQKKCNRILVGRFSLYCHTTNMLHWHHGPTSKIGGITFRVVLINYNSGIILTRGILYQKK